MKKIEKYLRNLLIVIASVSVMQSCTQEAEPAAEASANPKADKLDPGSAKGNEVLTLTGSGLGEITSIVFDKGDVPAPFNPVYNTDKSLIFRVPDTANGGEQNIIITNKIGKQFSVPFNVIALPLVSTVSNYNFVEGTQITLSGNNLEDVSSVVLNGSSDEATIVSKNKKQLVIKMPASNANTVSLVITNPTGPITTTQEFVNLDKAFKIFADNYENGFENGSWGPAEVSSEYIKSGSKSFKATYNKGNWSADGFANWNAGCAYSPDFKYLSFWVKGASADYVLYITGDQRAGGYGNSDRSAPIVIPANVWTYFKIPLSSLGLWAKGNTFKQLGFWIEGPDKQNESFYFDDVIFVK
ncbi:IPT/TIG domain-containing protein [Solitalea canadensis]|uniref:IPT/TIG domain-containing protein n=1 Tax=Solitalea canadensis (strain ATCC 29591 / DSM 3403 / JCM 21819 / LMG 8368 / NBRC 15130 / NCIMB 12057 / USAM 9D) TaxID=929556 RepID=H8KUQ7_SOLCM|nr:IPT/TIG domain-containing protein [Solitalea canadensis]AFD07541.1 IPT/TIG domain-containing protein [Solitalea canadensis DSM 3403]